MLHFYDVDGSIAVQLCMTASLLPPATRVSPTCSVHCQSWTCSAVANDVASWAQAQHADVAKARKEAEQAALKSSAPEIQPKRRRRRRQDGEPTLEQQAQELFSPSAERDQPPPPRRQSRRTQPQAPAANTRVQGRPQTSTSLRQQDSEPETSKDGAGSIPKGHGSASGAEPPARAWSGSTAPAPSRLRGAGLRHGQDFADDTMAGGAQAPAGWNIGSVPLG